MRPPTLPDALPIGLLTTCLLLTTSVLLHVFSWPTIVLSLALGALAGCVRFRSIKTLEAIEPAPANTERDRVRTLGTQAVIHLLQACTLLALFLQRTDEAIFSPWQVVPLSVFALFGLTLFVILNTQAWLNARQRSWIWFFQLFIAFGVSAIIYKLGFGFDPFIHQAAVRSLANHGDIQLPSILYVGQYAIEATIVRLTRLPIGILDPFLLPILGAWLGAFVVPRTLRLWCKESVWSPWPLLLLTFAPFTFTVPYYGAYLILLLGVFLLPYLRTNRGLLLAALLTGFALLVHPLLAIPLGTVIAGAFASRYVPKYAGALSFVGTFVSLAIAFYVYVHQLGGTISAPTFASLKDAWHIVTAFPYDTHNWSWYVSVFYRFFHIWPWIVIALGWYGYRSLPEQLKPLRGVLVGSGLGLFVIALGLAASVRFDNIASIEQFEFALRLRSAIPVLFLPGLFLAAKRLSTQLHPKRCIPAIACASLFITVIWFLSYPQANVFVMGAVPGLSVTEIRTVQTIESLSKGKTYAALTPQMVSAGALQQLGFEKPLAKDAEQSYPYAIPTGGAFYQAYMSLWSGADAASVIENARLLSKERQIFVVIPYTWDPNHALHDQLIPLSTESTDVDGTYEVYRFE